MKLYLKLEKAVDRGIMRPSSRGYLKRVVTGKDADGSPQYRYIRTQEALDAWEENQRKNKPDSKKEKKTKLKDKVDAEHKESTEKLTANKKTKEKTKKSLFVKKENT
jgi:hypothetical protein